ncbi:MAG TPA: hypothetical protein VNG69_01480 [Casimicrobiaceae bacterium]|nr:hypothetical protein [Casimicrobiaceae bacterium]
MILTEVRALVAREDFAGAMQAAGRYAPLGDRELSELFAEAATRESLRQRSMPYRALVARDCTEANVKAQFVRPVRSAEGSSFVRSAERLTGAPALETARVRFPLHSPASHQASTSQTAREAPASPRIAHHASVAQSAPAARSHHAGQHATGQTVSPRPIAVSGGDTTSAVSRETAPARPPPEYVTLLRAPDVDAVLCVWRVEGERRLANHRIGYAARVWMAPATDGTQLVADVVTYDESAH